MFYQQMHQKEMGKSLQAPEEYCEEASDISGILHLVSKKEIYSKWSASGSLNEKSH